MTGKKILMVGAKDPFFSLDFHYNNPVYGKKRPERKGMKDRYKAIKRSERNKARNEIKKLI